MEIYVNDFGPIKHCSFNLAKSMLIVYGQNNIGKSYAMQTVYLTLKSLIQMSEGIYFPYMRFEYANRERLQHLIMDFIRKNKAEEDITPELKVELNACLTEDIMPGLRESLENTFGHYESMVSDDTSIIIKCEQYNILFNLKKEYITVDYGCIPIVLCRTSSGFHKSRETKNGLHVYVLANNENKIEIKDAIEVLDEKIKEMRKSIAQSVKKYAGEVYYLPASRSGIMVGMNAMGQGLALMAQSRGRIHKKIEIPGISVPIYDYYSHISSINKRLLGRYYHHSERIERDILEGEVEFDSERMVIKYRQEGHDTEFEMSDVSSMVAEISPITVFIKYIIGRTGRKRGGRSDNTHTVLFIEEPEAHLHPLNQTKLMQAFCDMLDGDITIVLSSHSNYILNKMNNMVLKKSISMDTYDAVFMERLEDGRSITRVMPSDEYGVDDINFMDVANMLYDEREETIAEMFQKGQDD